MGFIVIILASNTGLAFAVVIHTPQYNAGYSAACNDSKHMFIWDNDGFIWEGFYEKYGSLTNNTQWMQGYRDGSICTHAHTTQYDLGFKTGCLDKHAGILNRDENYQYIIPQNHDKNWTLGFYDSTMDTTFCPAK
jgi:hypothetical protein